MKPFAGHATGLQKHASTGNSEPDQRQGPPNADQRLCRAVNAQPPVQEYAVAQNIIRGVALSCALSAGLRWG